jgi:hypothetical protein
MELDQVLRDLQLLWEYKPGAVVLLALGFVVFLFLVVDVWRHKRRRHKGPH